MSVFQYLELQPIEPQEDGTISELDQYELDDTIDLSQDEDGETLVEKIDMMLRDMHESADHQ